MSKLWRLYVGEIQRLFKYKIIVFSLLVTFIWLIIVALSDGETARSLAPTMIVMDSGMMSILLLAVNFFYEKQEGTIKTLFVTPVSLGQILLAKIASAMTAGIVSMLLVTGSIWLIHGIGTNVLLMAVYVLFIVAGNTAIGFVFILNSKDFLSMLVKIAGILMAFYIPSLLVPLNIIPDSWEFVALLSPVYCGSLLVEALYSDTELFDIIFSLGYLGAIAGILYPLVVYKRFKKVSVEG